MKFTTETNKVKDALQRLGFGVNSKSVLPVLANILVTVSKGEVLLTTTDLINTINYKIECETDGEGQFLIPFTHLKNIIALETGDVTIEWLGDEKGAQAQFAQDVFVLGNHGVVADFPKIPNLPTKGAVELNADFVSALSLASMSVSKDELRPAMCCICIELADGEVIVVSTDSFSVYAHTLKVGSLKTEKTELLIPTVAAKVVDGFKSIKMSYTKNNVGFESGPVAVICRRGEGKFPEWRRVMPEHLGNVKLELVNLKEAVGKAFVMSDATNNGIDFMLSPEQLEIRTNVVDTGMACSLKLQVESESPVNHIRLNGRLLKRIIAQLEENIADDSAISFGISQNNKPVTAKLNENENVTVLVMPISIDLK